jgi:hypothetical protein
MKKSLAIASAIGVMLCTGCIPMYFPKSKITVNSVFGEPVQKISVISSDRIAMFVQPEGYYEPHSGVVMLTTDVHGECEVPWRFRLAMPLANAVEVSVNPDFPGAQVNGSFDDARVMMNKGNDLHIVLRPLNIDYRLCNSISDNARRSDCLQYAYFFSAIRERDPSICNNYSFFGYFDELEKLKRLGVLSYSENLAFISRREACTTMVALLKNDKGVCDSLTDGRSSIDDERSRTLERRKSECLAAFEDPDMTGMLGTTNEEFRRFVCTRLDWKGRENRDGTQSPLVQGINLYRWSCHEAVTSQ